MTAYHEAGHTLVTLLTKHAAPVHKCTILPRGSSLGHTAMLPEKDQHYITRAQLLASLDGLMGGRVAEELIFGASMHVHASSRAGADQITTGAASDIAQATRIATEMVKTYGMSAELGLRDFNPHNESLISTSEFGTATQDAIDAEIKRLLQVGARANSARACVRHRSRTIVPSYCCKRTRANTFDWPKHCWSMRCSTPIKSHSSCM